MESHFHKCSGVHFGEPDMIVSDGNEVKGEGISEVDRYGKSEMGRGDLCNLFRLLSILYNY